MFRLIFDYACIVVPIAWLLLVGTSYAALFLFPEPPNALTAASPPPDLSGYSLAPLATLLILGIIRRSIAVRRSTPDEERK